MGSAEDQTRSRGFDNEVCIRVLEPNELKNTIFYRWSHRMEACVLGSVSSSEVVLLGNAKSLLAQRQSD